MRSPNRVHREKFERIIVRTRHQGLSRKVKDDLRFRLRDQIMQVQIMPYVCYMRLNSVAYASSGKKVGRGIGFKSNSDH